MRWRGRRARGPEEVVLCEGCGQAVDATAGRRLARDQREIRAFRNGVGW